MCRVCGQVHVTTVPRKCVEEVERVTKVRRAVVRARQIRTEMPRKLRKGTDASSHP